MASLPFQHHILTDAVAVLVIFRIALKGLRRQLPLNDAGTEGIGAHIVELFPALKILRHQLPVEKDDGHIVFLRHIGDRGRLRAVHQVHTDYIAALLNQGFHLLILGGLASRRIHHLHIDGRSRLLLQSRGAGVEPAHEL